MAVTRELKAVEGSMTDAPGACCLRSNILGWDAEEMWRAYTMLTDVEAVFRPLRSEPGLRPVHHRKQGPADARLFIPVIACQAIQVLRTRMKGFGSHDSWTALRPLQRTATTFARADGKALHLRKTADPDGVQAEIHHAMQIPPPPPNVRRTVV